MSEHSRRETLVRRFGADPISAATLQSGMQFHETAEGYIAYKKIGNVSIALGSPICDQGVRSELIANFIASHKYPLLCYLPESCLRDLPPGALKISGMGVDRTVDHRGLAVPNCAKIASALKKFYKARLAIAEFAPQQLSANECAYIAEIQSEYFSKFRYKKEITFLNAPLKCRSSIGKRYFFIANQEQERPVGIIVLNPFYTNFQIQGYLLDIIRFKKTKVWGIWLAVVSLLSELLAKENMRLSLGFCPLYGINYRESSHFLVRKQMEFIARQCLDVPYIRRLYELKMLIPGENEKRYFAHYSCNTLSALVTFLRASGVTLKELIWPSDYHPLNIFPLGGAKSDTPARNKV